MGVPSISTNDSSFIDKSVAELDNTFSGLKTGDSGSCFTGSFSGEGILGMSPQSILKISFTIFRFLVSFNLVNAEAGKKCC